MTGSPTLHILNKAPGHPRFEACLSVFAADDLLLLMENAVIALADKNSSLPACVCALSADCQARGIATRGVELVDYAGMVQLTDRFPRIISW